MTLRAQGWIVVSIAVCLFAFGCTEAKKSVPAGITWNKAIDAALADAQAHHRPILLDMYTDWCEWCKALDDTTYTDPKFIEYSKRFTMARMIGVSGGTTDAIAIASIAPISRWRC